MNSKEGSRDSNKGSKLEPISTTPSRASSRKPTKNAKITNFFAKVSSPLNKNSDSNHISDQSENDNRAIDELSKDASSSSMKMPDTCEPIARKKPGELTKEYVFIIPSSDDDTNISSKGGSQRRRRQTSVHSTNSRSSDGLILTSTNNELGIGHRQRAACQQLPQVPEKAELDSPRTPTCSSGRDSRSLDSMPEKRAKIDHTAINPHQTTPNQNSRTRINRIQPTLLRSRTKMIDFQSVPSDLNMPRNQASKLIEKLFLVKMPEDFFLFWDFAKTINHRKPCSAFSHAYLEWTLAGPFDVLSGLITDFHGFSSENLLRHCRFYYDPPEFQTLIIKKDSNHTHYGYFRDEPDQDKPIVVQNKTALGGQIHEVGDNIFTLLRSELDYSIMRLSRSSQDIPQPTFSSSSSKEPREKSSSNESSSKQSQLEKAKARQELTIIRDKLVDFCTSHENLSCESWARTLARRSKRFSTTLNNVGIVMPKQYDSYPTNLPGITDAKLRTILARISEFQEDKTTCSHYADLQQLIKDAIDLADDQKDFSRTLELGHNLFCQGDEFYHQHIECLLTKAYTSLGRDKFLPVLKAHLELRKKGVKVSLLD